VENFVAGRVHKAEIDLAVIKVRLFCRESIQADTQRFVVKTRNRPALASFVRHKTFARFVRHLCIYADREVFEQAKLQCGLEISLQDHVKRIILGDRLHAVGELKYLWDATREDREKFGTGAREVRKRAVPPRKPQRFCASHYVAVLTICPTYRGAKPFHIEVERELGHIRSYHLVGVTLARSDVDALRHERPELLWVHLIQSNGEPKVPLHKLVGDRMPPSAKTGREYPRRR